MTIVTRLAWAVAFALAVVRPAAAQKVEVADLVSRMGAYINSFVDGFSNVVAEETYQQEISSPHRKRQLESDLMLVKYPGADGWLMFRDTYEVDGKDVRGGPERLTRLFVDPPESALRRAREISAESARYNLANIGTVNNPLLVLALMQPAYHDRFRFTLGNLEKSMGPDVRILQFQEYRSPSIIKVDGNNDVFTYGLIWLEQATGRVLKTQLKMGRRDSGIQIETQFKPDPDLGIIVPVSMKEWYPDGNGGDITGTASYDHFRRFSVSTDETIKK